MSEKDGKSERESDVYVLPEDDLAGVSATAAAETEPEQDEVVALRQELADLRDRSMRTLADFDNYRKRSERERAEHRRYALAEPLRELLTVMDNLDLALRAGGSEADLRGGVELIARQLADLLRRFGVAEIEAVGKPFDPTRHEAVARREDAKVTAPTVVQELRRGYQLHDRLLRPAMVEVAVPVEHAASSAGATRSAGDA